MNKELQNKAWNYLPIEIRPKIKKLYCSSYKDNGYHRGRRNSLERIFGKRNLNSASDREEMLHVSAERVKNRYLINEEILKHNPERYELKEVNRVLKLFFGSKCKPDFNLPEKTDDDVDQMIDVISPNLANIGKDESLKPSNSGELKSQESDNQAKPFKLGDKVQFINTPNSWLQGEIGIIERLPTETNPLFKVKYSEDEYTLLESKYLAPYTEEKNDMEEKELNLCELLKGCEEEEFYCHYLRRDVKFIGFDECDGMTFKLRTCKDGVGYENLMYIEKNEKIGKSFILYPSRALYEKYPLDAKKAWSEWAENRKPKYEVSIHYQIIGNNNDDEVGKFNTIYCNSLEEAQQAAEEVRKCLQAFHARKEGER